MKSKRPGGSTSGCSVTNVTPFGVWVLLRNSEYFLSHTRFPFFQDASVADVLNVEAPSAQHLRWPQLDIDIHVDSIESPEKYPLVAKRVPNKRLERTPPLRRRSA